MFLVTFEFSKKTKNTVVFEEVDHEVEGGAEVEKVVGSLYVQQKALAAVGIEEDDYEDLVLSVMIEEVY